MNKSICLILALISLEVSVLQAETTSEPEKKEKPMSLIQKASLAREKRLEEEAAQRKKEDAARLKSYKVEDETEETEEKK